MFLVNVDHHAESQPFTLLSDTQTDRQTDESLTSRCISLQTKIYVFPNYEVRDSYYGGADIV